VECGSSVGVLTRRTRKECRNGAIADCGRALPRGEPIPYLLATTEMRGHPASQIPQRVLTFYIDAHHDGALYCETPEPYRSGTTASSVVSGADRSSSRIFDHIYELGISHMNAHEFLTDVVSHLYVGFDRATITPQNDHLLVHARTPCRYRFVEARLPPVAGISTSICIDNFRKKGKYYSYKEQPCDRNESNFEEVLWDLTINYNDLKVAYDAIRAHPGYNEDCVFVNSRNGIPHIGGVLSYDEDDKPLDTTEKNLVDIDRVFSTIDFGECFFRNKDVEVLLKKQRNVRIFHTGALGLEYDGYHFFVLGHYCPIS
jgi:hypothetical protein